MRVRIGTIAKVLLAVGIAVGAATMYTTTANAHSAPGVPYHAAANVQCFVGAQGRTVKAFAANDMRSVSGGIETVYWSSDLYRHDGTSWQPYNTSAGWLNAAANAGGLLGSNGVIWYGAGARAQNNWTYSSLPAGHYAIKQFFGWNNGLVHTEWSAKYNNVATSYCTLY